MQDKTGNKSGERDRDGDLNKMQVVHSDIKQLYVLVIDNSSVQELTKQISGDNNFYNFAPRVFQGIKALFPIYGAKTLFLDKHLLCTEQQVTTRISSEYREAQEKIGKSESVFSS